MPKKQYTQKELLDLLEGKVDNYEVLENLKLQGTDIKIQKKKK